ncbi:MAG: autotransporter outer membrane beta-barrel domain-containing protein, partial [Opitutus sp.]
AGNLTGYNYGYFVGTHRVPILRAASITGTFSSAPNLSFSPMLAVGVEYSATEVAYVYTQRPFAKAGATPSQQLLGAHLDATLPGTSGVYYNLVLFMNSLQDTVLIAAGLGELAPDRYAVLNEQGFATAATRQAALDRRLAGLRAAPAGAAGFTAFLESGQVRNKFAALEGLPEVAMHSSGGLFGVAWRQGRWIAGATVAKDRTRAALDGLGSTARLTTTTPGLFAQYDAGRYFVQAAISRSDDDYTLVRDSGISYRPARVQAAANGSRTDFSVTAGTTFRGKDWSVTPYAGLLSSRVRLDDFAETRFSGTTGTELA